jgi:hypothetical protein
MQVDLTGEYAKYLGHKSLESHSKDGMVDLTFDQSWPEVATLAFEATKESGVSAVCHVLTTRTCLTAFQIKWNGYMNTGDALG